MGSPAVVLGRIPPVTLETPVSTEDSGYEATLTRVVLCAPTTIVLKARPL